MRLPCSSAFRNFFRKLRHFIQIYHGNNFLIRACIINRTRLTISSNIRSFKEQVNFQRLCNHQDDSKTAVYIHIYVYIHSPAFNKMSLRHPGARGNTHVRLWLACTYSWHSRIKRVLTFSLKQRAWTKWENIWSEETDRILKYQQVRMTIIYDHVMQHALLVIIAMTLW